MKLGENNYVLRQSFSPSFIRIGQKLWIFSNGQFLNVCWFFYSDFNLKESKNYPMRGCFLDVLCSAQTGECRLKIDYSRNHNFAGTGNYEIDERIKSWRHKRKEGQT